MVFVRTNSRFPFFLSSVASEPQESQTVRCISGPCSDLPHKPSTFAAGLVSQVWGSRIKLVNLSNGVCIEERGLPSVQHTTPSAIPVQYGGRGVHTMDLLQSVQALKSNQ